jgi:Fe2+ transport system protein B
METRKGVKTERGNHNREIESINREIRQLRARIRKYNEWIYSQPIEDTPKMIEVATRNSKGENLNTRWKKVANLQSNAKLLCFMQDNHITDMAQLADKVKKINNEFMM